MKRLLISLVILLNTVAFAEAVTLKETQEFLDNTQEFYVPPDKELDMDGYYYQAVDIYKFWKKTGIEPAVVSEYDGSYLFGCKVGEDKCLLSSPETEMYELGRIKVLRITGSLSSDYQYLFFKEDEGRWVYFDHIDIFDDKYSEPQIKLLDDNFFYVTTMNIGGTEVIGYITLFYTVSDGKLKEPQWCPARYERSSWGWMYNRKLEQNISYKDNVLGISYAIEFRTNPFYTEPAIEDFPLFKVNRKTVFNWNGKDLIFDEEASQLSSDDLHNLANEDYDKTYSIFKEEFEGIKDEDEKHKNWHEEFIAKVKLEESI